MLQAFTTVSDELIKLVQDDPVRPEISIDQRINHNSRIYVLRQDDRAVAVTCVKFLASIPATVEELSMEATDATTAVFYTIWSYAAGAGRALIRQACQSIEQEFPEIKTYVTLSPKTEMAQKFHLNNGAGIYRDNPTSVNYLYK